MVERGDGGGPMAPTANSATITPLLTHGRSPGPRPVPVAGVWGAPGTVGSLPYRCVLSLDR